MHAPERYCPSSLTAAAKLLAATLALAAWTSAQCANVWLPGSGTRGVNGHINASAFWDPDGAGPAPGQLVVAGSFTFAGTRLANSIATWNPATGAWSALGSGTGGTIQTLAVLPNGNLVAGGNFSSIGGTPANNIAQWNGIAWSPLGAGITGSVGTSSGVTALAVAGNGNLFVGGAFTTAGGQPANRVARWDGLSWSPVGTGVSGGFVGAMAVMPNGNLVVGGGFSSAGGTLVGGVLTGAVVAGGIAMWNGAVWSSLTGGVAGTGGVMSLLALPGGDLVAGGSFTSIAGFTANQVARWNGTTWSAVGTGLGSSISGSVTSLALLPNGNIAVGRYLAPSSTTSPVPLVMRWDGSVWHAIHGITYADNGGRDVRTLTVLPTGDLVAAGRFPLIGPGAVNVARWNGSAWSALSLGTDGAIHALATMPNGDLVAAGTFLTIHGATNIRIARWNGSTWTPLTHGLDDDVLALATLPNGDLIAGGAFATVGGVLANSIARWNGSTWARLGSGVESGATPHVFALAALPNGDVVAGGAFTHAGGFEVNGLARWNGSAWSPVGFPFLGYGLVNALALLPNGDLVVAGGFRAGGSSTLNSIARWTGTNWLLFGSGINGTVSALAVQPNGDLFAGGSFAVAGGVVANSIARWNGSAWSALGSGVNGAVHALATLPNGDLVAAGAFTNAGGVAANRIARWNGSAWSPLGSGLDGRARALAARPNGDLLVGGEFLLAGGAVSSYLAHLSTTCPATATASGIGCVGSGGNNQLTAVSLPWLGSTFVARATGMPNNALALGIVGQSLSAVPLSTILQQGLPNCTLWVSPDVLQTYVLTSSSLSVSLTIPNSAALVGATLHQQVVPLELDALGNIVALTSTNALSITLGSF